MRTSVTHIEYVTEVASSETEVNDRVESTTTSSAQHAEGTTGRVKPHAAGEKATRLVIKEALNGKILR